MHLNSLCAGKERNNNEIVWRIWLTAVKKKEWPHKMKRKRESRMYSRKRELKIKLRKYDTTMTMTIRYNYVFAFIHYYCLTALSASLFRCAKCALLHKAFPLWPHTARTQFFSVPCCHSVPCACCAMVIFQMCVYGVYYITCFFSVCNFVYISAKKNI